MSAVPARREVGWASGKTVLFDLLGKASALSFRFSCFYVFQVFTSGMLRTFAACSLLLDKHPSGLVAVFPQLWVRWAVVPLVSFWLWPYVLFCRCQRCGSESSRAATFYELDVSIRGHSTLMSSLHDFLKVKHSKGQAVCMFINTAKDRQCVCS